jgi:putative FmdB family regulatory protein
MPLYEYECGACGQRFELIRRHSDGPVDVCTLCGKGPVTRLFSSPAIQFKGSGFYITDYAKKGDGGKGDGATGGKAGKTAAEQKSDAKSDAAAAGKGGSSEAKPAASSTSDTTSTSSTPAAAPAKPTASKD